MYKLEVASQAVLCADLVLCGNEGSPRRVTPRERREEEAARGRAWNPAALAGRFFRIRVAVSESDEVHGGFAGGGRILIGQILKLAVQTLPLPEYSPTLGTRPLRKLPEKGVLRDAPQRTTAGVLPRPSPTLTFKILVKAPLCRGSPVMSMANATRQRDLAPRPFASLGLRSYVSSRQRAPLKAPARGGCWGNVGRAGGGRVAAGSGDHSGSLGVGRRGRGERGRRPRASPKATPRPASGTECGGHGGSGAARLPVALALAGRRVPATGCQPPAPGRG